MQLINHIWSQKELDFYFETGTRKFSKAFSYSEFKEIIGDLIPSAIFNLLSENLNKKHFINECIYLSAFLNNELQLIYVIGVDPDENNSFIIEEE